MRRRVGSASAAKVWFNVRGEYLTIWLTISYYLQHCKHFSTFLRRPAVAPLPSQKRRAADDYDVELHERAFIHHPITGRLSLSLNASLFTTYGIFVGSPP